MHYCVHCLHLCHVASGILNVKIVATAYGLFQPALPAQSASFTTTWLRLGREADNYRVDEAHAITKHIV
ncbi:hypothetical protein CAter10_3828 [Collimonas arenae]|nr:hypothetical protein CAter10_3828 [Collimonas arenae]